MRINATSGREASKTVLKIILTSDFHFSGYRQNPYGYTYVYFNPETAKFSFETIQRKDTSFLLKRYRALDMEDIIDISSSKYTFSQIAIGAINSRRLMTHKEFFQITKEHFDWI